MKKQLLAIAVSAAAAAPMAAMAQENADGPNVYGRWDVTAQTTDSLNNNGGKQGGTTPFANETNSRFNGNDVGDQDELRSNTSYLGIKGGADLDHQLQAMYQLEMGFNPGLDRQNSVGVPNFQLRNTYAGLGSDGWGKVFAGRYDSIIKQAEFSVDQFGYTDADMDIVLGNRGQTRYEDTLNYHSPKFGPSLQVKLQFRPGESRVDTDDTGENDRETSLVDGMGISLGMQEGNMYGAIAYETAQQKFGPAPAANEATSDLETMRVTGGLDDDMFGVGFLYEQQETSDAGDAYGDNYDDSRSSWLLSGRYNVTEPLAIKLQYGTGDTNIPGVSTDDPARVHNDDEQSVTSTTLGADYSLGQQTKVYTFYSMNEVDGDADLNNDGNFDEESDAEFNVLAVGMEHKF